jgi:CelD/BcsL family acetyltransferase involved in cellulose biosynthesis
LSRGSTSGGLRADVVTAKRAPDALARRWRELAVAAENPFALPEWHGAWVAAHPADAPFVLVCRERSGEVAGVVALVLRRRRLLVPGEQLADWFGPACAPHDEARVAAAVVDALARTKQRWDVGQLDRCQSGGAWIDGLARAAAGSSVKLLPHHRDEVLVSVDLVRDGPDLTTGKKRRELDRLGRRLREAHDVTLRCDTTPAQIQRDVDALLRLRTARWGAGFDAAAEAFLRALAGSLARQDLRLWVIDVDGAPAAVLLGWRLGGRAFAYSQAFDRTYERFGIGMALLAHAVRAAADEGCARFDMLRGDERFKASFHITSETVSSYRAVRRRSLARLEAEGLAGARSVYRRLSPQRRARLRRALRIRAGG